MNPDPMEGFNRETLVGSVQQIAAQSTDPLKRMLANMALTQMQESSAVEKNEVQAGGNFNRKQMLSDIQTLLKINRNLITTLKTAQQRNHLMASALGACPCWGTDSNCQDCHGSGAPGTKTIESSAFQQLVLPLFQSLIATANSHADDRSS